jgi:hypothetical protein
MAKGRLVGTVVGATVTGVTRVGTPKRGGPIKLIVWVRRDGTLACRVSRFSPQPFNPYFSRSRLFGLLPARWAEPSGSRSTSVDAFIARVATALRVLPTTAELHSAHIGNHAAAEWFRHWQDKASRVCFPIPLGRAEHREERRKFAIMKEPETAADKMKVGADRRFRVDATVEGYQPEAKSDSLAKSSMRGKSIVEGAVQSTAILYIKDAAMRRIHDHIQWKRSVAANMVEQGGILLGTAGRDPETGRVYALATDAVPARVGAHGSGAHLELGHEAWHRMLEELDAMRGVSGTAVHVIGWYHTHPGHLDVFMSSVDRHTQAKLFTEDWQFAIVLNPQKAVWRAFSGRGAEECQGFWLEPTPF